MRIRTIAVYFIHRVAPVFLAGVLFTTLWKPVIEPWFQDIGIVSKEDEEKKSGEVEIKTITEEEFNDKTKEKESFLLYVGRSSCPDCKVFEEILSEINTEAVLYKLDTQKYKDAIDAEEGNAQELYDVFKRKIGYKWIPYVSVYVKGEQDNDFAFEFPDELRTLKQEEQDEYWEDVKVRFIIWLEESMNAVRTADSACGVDERCE